MSLPPGKYTLEAAVLDRESDQLRAGVKKQSVMVAAPPAPSELSLSSLIRVRKLAPLSSPVADDKDPFQFKGGRVRPELSDTVTGGKGAAIGIYLVATVQQDQEATVTLDFVQDGKPVARSEPPLPKADDSGRIHFVANLPIESLKPGSYEVYAKLQQGGRSVRERLFINIVQ